jgi:hypothetical protein
MAEGNSVGRTDQVEAINFLSGNVVSCDDYGLVVTSVLTLGGVERRSTNTKPMATPNKTSTTHTYHCGCFFLAWDDCYVEAPPTGNHHWSIDSDGPDKTG